MKLLVIQEQHFVRMPNGEVWVDEQSDSKFWERYLDVFEEVVVCGRFKHVESYETDKLIRSDRPHVTFVEMPNFRGVAGLLKNELAILTCIWKAMKECDRIIFRAPSPISMIAYPLARMSRKPYAAELMNNPYTHFSPEAMHHFYQPLLRAFIVWQTKNLCRNAYGVSYVTEHVLQDLYPSYARLHGESKKHFEGNYSTIRIEKEKYNYFEGLNERPDPIIFIHTGKMQDNRKGQDVFIHMLAILKEKKYSVRGILVGDGEMRPQFEALGEQLGMAQQLEFVGWKAGFETVKAELNRAHIAVFPSKGEGLPRSVIEGMSQGLLCFGSKVDGICELLEGDCLVPEFTAECFARHVEIYLKDWNKIETERRRQFETAQRYEHTKLKGKRKVFYEKLRNVK